MKTLIDTPIWSLFLRREPDPRNNRIIDELQKKVFNSEAIMLGPIRQELLSGIKDKSVFEMLRNKLSLFKDHPLTTFDYEKAAELYNTCRAKGVQGAGVDFLICAVALNNNLSIFTLDHDFRNYAKIIPIKIEPKSYK